jgi:FkbM family methyltransferase
MLAARGLRWYLRTNLRGRTRLTGFLTRNLPVFWSVPVHICDYPPIYVDLRTDHARFLLRGEPWPAPPREQAEQTVMRRLVRPGDVAFDIGANVGLHSVLLSGNASLFDCALSDDVGPAQFFVPADNMKASLANWTDRAADGEAREVTCQRARLDDLPAAGAVPQPDFIKCDVEGAELLVFRGARRLLDRPDAPIVLFEINGHTAAGFGLDPMEAKNFLEHFELPEYAFYQVRADGSLLRLGTSNPWSNVLAVPRSRLAELSELGAPVVNAG